MKKRLLMMLALLVVSMQVVLAQAGMIRGKVLDDKGEPIAGATIRVKGTSKGTVTDPNGNFRVNAVEGDMLVISAIGMKVTEKPAEDGMNVKMAADTRSLGETVVTAQAIKREKASLGYATTTLKSEEINQGNNVSALSALTGKASGVNVTSSTGGPGGSTRVVIRGEKSLGGNNNALIVIDGVPVNNGNRTRANSLQQIDFGNRGNDINPDDIESINVLKGAAATALYGSDGANGAIMITTKSGKGKKKGTGRTEITFSTAHTWSNVLRYPEFQNEFGQGDLNGVYDDRRENFSWGARFNGELRPWGQIVNGNQKVKPYVALEDNVKNFFNTGKTWENNLSLGGGSESTTYFLSLNTLNNKGVTDNTSLDRYSFRFNGTHNFTNKFYTTLNVNYITSSARIDQSGQGEGSVWNNVLQQPRDIPITELKDLDDPFNNYYLRDTFGNRYYGYYGAYTENPYWVAKYFDNRNKYDRMFGQASVGYRFNADFDLMNRFGGEVLSDRTYIKKPKLPTTNPMEGGSGDLWEGQSKVFNGGYYEGLLNYTAYYNDLMLTYNHRFNKVGINALVGHNVQQRLSRTLESDIDDVTNGLVIEDWYSFDNAKSPISVSNNQAKNRKVGLYGTFNFDYDQIFFLELTGRNDWSSTLRTGNNSYFYPGISASWVFSRLFTESVQKTFSFGKLRANYAEVGNDATAYANNGAGFTKTNIDGGFGSTLFPFNGVPGFNYQNSFGDPFLLPERSRTAEIGTDLSFFNNRLNVDFTVYKNSTKNQIIGQLVSPSSGFTSRTVNAGVIVNKGFEIGLRATPVKLRNGFRWDVYGTFTKNTNEVESLSDGLEYLVLGGYSGMSIVAAVGKPFGTFYSTDLLRDAQGRVVVDSATGNPLSTAKPTYLGSFQPRYIASWGTSLSFKGFAFNILFDTKQGGMFYSRTKDITEFVGTSSTTVRNGNRDPFVWDNSVYQDYAGNYVPNTTVKTDVYTYYTAANVKPASQDLVDASYVKLRELSLSYTFPSKLLSKTKLGGASVGLFGNNLFIWTHKNNTFVDPEVNSGGASNEQGFDFSARPSLRNYGVRLSITF